MVCTELIIDLQGPAKRKLAAEENKQSLKLLKHTDYNY